MGDETKAFNEVRALLSKLDRSIDEARTKRVGSKEEPQRPASNGNAGGNGQSARPDLDQRIGGGSSRPFTGPSTTPVPPPAIQAKRSQYGRARPLTRTDETPKRPESENQWKSPKNYDDLTIG